MNYSLFVLGKTITFVICLFFAATIPSQLIGQGSTLMGQLDQLKKEVGDVETEKKKYSQELLVDPENAYKVELVTKETDNKGKTIEKKFMFNFGLMEKNLVKRDNSKELMWISAKSGKTPIIKTYVEGTLSDYTSNLEFYCRDIDHARKIEGLIKSIIPLAEKEWKNSVVLPKDLNGLRDWLKINIVDVNEGETQIKQELAVKNVNNESNLVVAEYDTKGVKKSESFTFDFGDLNERSVSMRVHRKRVSVVVNTNQNFDFIKTEENGQVKKYNHSLEIYFDDVDKAQIAILGLQEMIPKAKKDSEQKVVTPSSLKEGLAILTRLTKNFTVNDENYEHALIEGALTTYTQKVNDKKGDVDYSYTFDFSDLNETSLSIKPVRHNLLVEATAKNRKALIEVHKNGEQQNYGQQVKFHMEDITSAKQFLHALKFVIAQSPKSLKPKDFEWLKNSFTTFDEKRVELKQTLDLRDGEKCKIAFTTTKELSKKVDEHIIEFNFYDIDPNNLTLNIKGKKVEVSLTTNYNESIIKDYQNGGKISYTKQVSFSVPDIETGKIMLATLEKVVKDCSTK